MSDTKIYNGSSRAINCDVSNCKYHSTSDCCTAKQIDVQSENALRKAETYCSTFETK